MYTRDYVNRCVKCIRPQHQWKWIWKRSMKERKTVPHILDTTHSTVCSILKSISISLVRMSSTKSKTKTEQHKYAKKKEKKQHTNVKTFILAATSISLWLCICYVKSLDCWDYSSLFFPHLNFDWRIHQLRC